MIFIKVNVDTCKDLASRNEIKAMPTFIFYNSNGEKVSTVQGWQGDIKPFDDFAKANGKKAPTEAATATTATTTATATAATTTTTSAAETTQRANETAKDK